MTRVSVKEIIEKYKELKSLRKTAFYFSMCRDAVRKIIPDELIKNPKPLKPKKNSKDVVSWRQRAKQLLVEYKGGKCERCGYCKSIKALSFHHIDPTQKDFTISGKSRSLEILKKEADKCEMVCSNCHIEIHEELYNNRI